MVTRRVPQLKRFSQALSAETAYRKQRTLLDLGADSSCTRAPK